MAPGRCWVLLRCLHFCWTDQWRHHRYLWTYKGWTRWGEAQTGKNISLIRISLNQASYFRQALKFSIPTFSAHKVTLRCQESLKTTKKAKGSQHLTSLTPLSLYPFRLYLLNLKALLECLRIPIKLSYIGLKRARKQRRLNKLELNYLLMKMIQIHRNLVAKKTHRDLLDASFEIFYKHS